MGDSQRQQHVPDRRRRGKYSVLVRGVRTPSLGLLKGVRRGDHSHGGKIVAANSGSEKYIAGTEGEKERMRDLERLSPTVVFVKGGAMSTRNMDLDFHSRSQRKPW